MLLGTHTPRLDEKGRVVLPAKWRDQLADGVVLTKGQERCVYVFATAEFARRTAPLEQAPLGSTSTRAVSRVLFGSASDEGMDKQGRITVPAGLRAWAGLDRDCVVVGAGARAELWDAAAWETYLAENEDAFAELGEDLPPVI